MHRPQTADWQPCHSGQYLWTSRPSSTQAQAADRLIDSLAACEGPHLKALILNNSYLAPAHRARHGLLALYEEGRMPSRRELQG